MASAYRPAYLLDTVNIVSCPINYVYTLRYLSRYIANKEKQSTIENIKNINTSNHNLKDYNCLLTFFDKTYIPEKKDSLKEAFIPLRWGKIVQVIVEDREAFIQLEVLLGPFFDMKNESDKNNSSNINNLDKIRDNIYTSLTNTKWNDSNKQDLPLKPEDLIDEKRSSIKYFLFPIMLNYNEYINQNDVAKLSGWREICENLYKINSFKNSVFLLMRGIFDVKSQRHIDMELLEPKLYGYSLDAEKIYNFEIIQFMEPEIDQYIETAEYKLKCSNEQIKFIDNYRNILTGGPYRINIHRLYSKKSYISKIGLFEISSNLKLKNEKKEQPTNYQMSTLSNVVLSPNYSIVMKIKSDRKLLVLTIIFLICGLFLSLLNYLIKIPNNAIFFVNLLSIVLIGAGGFILATIQSDK